MEEAVGIQHGTGPEPTAEDHQETGEDAEEPDVDKKMEEDKPCQDSSKPQQPPLSK